MRFEEGKSATLKLGKRVRKLLLKCTTVVVVLSTLMIYPACSGNFLGMQDYQRDLLFGLGSLALNLLSPGATAATAGPAGPAGEPGEQGPAGSPGPSLPGLACWDLNGNSLGDVEEDINGDQIIDALDCQGAAGQNGADGAEGQDGAAGASGSTGAAGPAGPTGATGAAGATGATGAAGEAGPTLFDTFIDELYTVQCGSYGELTNEVLDPVGVVEPGLGDCTCNDACDAQCTDVVAYKTPIGYRYGGGPVVMSLYFWREGPKTEGCFALRLNAYQGRHNESIIQYGGQRVIVPELVGPLFDGILLVVDLPLNVELLGPQGPGLGFPDDLLTQDLLAFELNTIAGFDDGGCYTLLGAEFIETAEATTAAHARIYADVDALLGDPNSNCRVLCGDDVDCSEFDDACNVGVCNEQTGECGSQPANNNEPCDDGSACTANDMCAAGTCGGEAIGCNDENVCTEDSCDDAVGCVYMPVVGICDDGDACTTADMCSDGECGGTAVDCADAGDQCNTASCDPDGEDGNCDTITPEADQTPCDDGIDCTGDVCIAGECVSTPDDAACSDEEFCTGDESCNPNNDNLPSGCMAGTPPDDCCEEDVDCEDELDCTINTCNFDTGECQIEFVHSDGDGVADCTDNCPFDDNPGQEDGDEDGIGDICDICPTGPNDVDADADGIPDGCDICPDMPDAPGNGTCVNAGAGGPCVEDADCPVGSACSNNQEDSDGDGFGDACDACPLSEDVGEVVDLFPQCGNDNLVENVPNEVGCTPQDLFNDCVAACACAAEGGAEGQLQSCITGNGGCSELLVALGICDNNGCINSCTGQLDIVDFLGECCDVDAECDMADPCITSVCGDDGVCDHMPIPGCD